MECCVFGNLYNGLCVAGEDSNVELERCNIFHNGLNGIDALGDIRHLVVSECSIHDNLNGINRWVYNAEDSELEAISTKHLADNVIRDNRRDECKVRSMPKDGRSLADMAIDQNICTFALTGPHFIKQDVWTCSTCKLSDTEGCCAVCVRTCHSGHDVELAYEAVDYYCDCSLLLTCSFRTTIEDKLKEKIRLGSQMQNE